MEHDFGTRACGALKHEISKIIEKYKKRSPFNLIVLSVPTFGYVINSFSVHSPFSITCCFFNASVNHYPGSALKNCQSPTLAIGYFTLQKRYYISLQCFVQLVYIVIHSEILKTVINGCITAMSHIKVPTNQSWFIAVARITDPIR
ncbi:hypothetical protein V6Z11_A08G167700 [Gossypium hirsutum]